MFSRHIQGLKEHEEQFCLFVVCSVNWFLHVGMGIHLVPLHTKEQTWQLLLIWESFYLQRKFLLVLFGMSYSFCPLQLFFFFFFPKL